MAGNVCASKHTVAGVDWIQLHAYSQTHTHMNPPPYMCRSHCGPLQQGSCGVEFLIVL